MHLYLKDYPTHECVNAHITSVQVYLLTSRASAVRTLTESFDYD